MIASILTLVLLLTITWMALMILMTVYDNSEVTQLPECDYCTV
jgi:hypothetical protein